MLIHKKCKWKGKKKGEVELWLHTRVASYSSVFWGWEEAILCGMPGGPARPVTGCLGVHTRLNWFTVYWFKIVLDFYVCFWTIAGRFKPISQVYMSDCFGFKQYLNYSKCCVHTLRYLILCTRISGLIFRSTKHRHQSETCFIKLMLSWNLL